MKKFWQVYLLGIPFDTPVDTALIFSNIFLLSNPSIQRAMKAHASQFVWFRVLNAIFSRYFIINTIRSLKIKEDSWSNKLIDADPVECKMPKMQEVEI